MRTLFKTLPLIALLAAPLTVFGGTTGASATMQVSFTVLASCTVNAHGAAAPGVECMQADGYIVQQKPVTQAASTQSGTAPVTSNTADGWTVYF
jgi:hypothetical protein